MTYTHTTVDVKGVLIRDVLNNIFEHVDSFGLSSDTKAEVSYLASVLP